MSHNSPSVPLYEIFYHHHHRRRFHLQIPIRIAFFRHVAVSMNDVEFS
jgi:hypothetical protein